MKNRWFALAFAPLALVAAAVLAADAPKLDGITCPVSGKPVSAEHFVMHNGGKVYVCCPGCKGKATANAAVANAQLVATHQAKQKCCPISGRATSADHTVKVLGSDIAFCCPNCKGKVAGAKDAEAAEICYSEAAFKKAFEVKAE